MVLSPEHPLVEKITTDENKEAVEDYQKAVQSLSEIDRTSTAKEKTGVFTGAYAINPVNEEKIPIWIADYVLMTYGTGAIMAVPGQDERDWEFAEKFDIPIVRTVQPPEDFEGKAYTGDGPAINSSFLDGLNVVDAKVKITEWLVEKGIGESKVNYRLRDWLISRQRFWGTPIPIVYCDKCGEVPIPEDQLPVELPYDVEFKHDGGSPLESNEEFVNTTCPTCGGPAKRDVDTMDTFVDSSWYYLRYLDPNFIEAAFNAELAERWTPVNMYVGGAEHATMHLLYARFIHKFIRDLGLVSSDEPFQKLIHQGTITNNGAKMSKSKGNVVNPDGFIKDYGSDVFRMYMMFMGPYELGGDWSDKGIVGVDRFVQRFYTLVEKNLGLAKKNKTQSKYELSKLSAEEQNVYRKVNKTLNKFEVEIDNFRFNTAVASLMELLNDLMKDIDKCSDELKLYALERFISMLAPLAPHMGEETWMMLGNQKTLFENPVWYKFDDRALVEDSVTIVVQVMGKVRAKLELPKDVDEDTVKQAAWQNENVKLHAEGKQIIKEIYVKNKIYNIVAK
jgi:leucyl-tRNA synthetase